MPIDTINRRHIWCAAFFVALFSAMPAHADPTVLRCDLYQSSEQVPGDVQSIMYRRRDSAAEACRRNGGKLERYFAVSRASINEAGVCQFLETEVDTRSFEATNHVGTYILSSPSPSCPDQGDPEYISSDGVSPKMSVALSRFWKGLGQSKEQFYSATSGVSDTMRASGAFKLAEDAFVAHRSSIKLTSISTIPRFPGITTAEYVLLGRFQAYKSVALYVDRVGSEFRVVSVGLVVE